MNKHSHYYKDVRHLSEVDVYRVLELFGVTSQPIGHAIKKLLLPGERGGGKGLEQDVKEAIDTLNRWLQMRHEDAFAGLTDTCTVTPKKPALTGDFVGARVDIQAARTYEAGAAATAQGVDLTVEHKREMIVNGQKGILSNG